MPTYTIETAAGRKLKIEAGKPEDALAAANEWQKTQDAARPSGDKFFSNMNASASGFLEGIPLVGPALNKGADYVEAALRPGSDINDVQRQEAEDRRLNPGTTTLGNLAVCVYAGAAAAPVIGPLAGGLSRGAQIATGIVGGSGLGATDAAIRAEPGERGRAALLGGALGAAAGAAAPVVAGLVGKGVNAVANTAARAGALRGSGLSPGAARVVLNAAEGDIHPGGPGIANIAAAGPNGMLADAGPSTAGLLDTVIARGGAGAGRAAERIGDRAAAEGQTLGGVMDQPMGAAQGVRTTQNAINAQGRPVIGPAYDAAYKAPVDYSSADGLRLRALIARLPDAAKKRAQDLMDIEGVASPYRLTTSTDDAMTPLTGVQRTTSQRLPNVQQLDYITRALNDVAESTDGTGAMGGMNTLGRSVSGLSRDIRQTLRRMVPDYAAALDSAENTIGQRKAVEFGAKMMSPAMPRDVAAEGIDAMSAAEKAQARQGARSWYDEKMANVRSTILNPDVDIQQAQTAVKELSSDAVRDKLRMLMGKQDADAIIAQANRTGQAMLLRARTAVNSRTAGRLAGKQAIEDMTAPGMLGQLSRGNIPQAGKAAIQAGLGTTPADDVAAQNVLYSQIADALTQKRGGDALRLMAQLQKAQSLMQRSDALSRLLGQGVAGATAGSIEGPRSYLLGGR
jgi:hypothetical protein